MNGEIGLKVDVDYLRVCLEYKDGALFWRRRPVEHFRSERGYKIWNTRFSGKRAGSVTSHGYRSVSVGNNQYYEHQVIYAMFHDEWPSNEIDHNDGNRQNNKIENLQDTTYNHRNKRLLETNSSGLHGVYWDKQQGKWSVQISMDGIKTRLGRFESFLDACCIRKSAELKYNYSLNHGRSLV